MPLAQPGSLAESELHGYGQALPVALSAQTLDAKFP